MALRGCAGGPRARPPHGNGTIAGPEKATWRSGTTFSMPGAPAPACFSSLVGVLAVSSGPHVQPPQAYRTSAARENAMMRRSKISEVPPRPRGPHKTGGAAQLGRLARRLPLPILAYPASSAGPWPDPAHSRGQQKNLLAGMGRPFLRMTCCTLYPHRTRTFLRFSSR